MNCAYATLVLFTALLWLVNTSDSLPCDSKPCKNFGICTEVDARTYTCACVPGTSGKNCENGTSACFPINSMVMLESGQRIPIQDVSVGDRLLSFDSSGKLFFSEVAMWMDRVSQMKHSIIQLITQTGKMFKATPYHVVLVGDTFTQMRHVKVGDELLLTDDGKQLHKEKVESIAEISNGIGAFAPLTYEGTIVVDGVAASCYAYSHALGQIAFAPMKLMSKLGIVSGNTDGMHWYSKMLMDWTQVLGAPSWLIT